ncbi:MAG: MFS transporter [Oscillospiraceae bacterium]|nr:MFS transporter [Oscillospiraceae bacterium]
MVSFVLVMIYVAFIGLGLPDPLLGAAWPVMHNDLQVPLSYMGILSMVITMGTVISSLFTGAFARRMGTGLLTALSVAMTAVGLLGFGVSRSFLALCMWAIPYGLGAGAVDAALNHYVAVHYAARHMSWLHCFWGVGTVASPYIMGAVLTDGAGWQKGYLTVAVVQAIIAGLLFVSIPKWVKPRADEEEKQSGKGFAVKELLRTPVVPLLLMIFFCYCAMEATAGLWASSYLCEYKGVNEQQAASYAALFYMGITLGRLVGGFITDKAGDRRLIVAGMSIFSVAIVMMAADRSGYGLTLAGLFLTGLGCAPIYPSMLHMTPAFVGKEKSLYLVGIQMASAYLGINFMPTLFGVLHDHVWNGLFPFYLLIFAVLMIVAFRMLCRRARKEESA